MAQALIHDVLGEDIVIENLSLINGRDLVGMAFQ